MTGFQISPDGKHMLALESHGDVRNILVWKLADLGGRPTVIGARNMQITSASFLKNDMLQVLLMQPFDLRTEEHLGPAYRALNPQGVITNEAGKLTFAPANDSAAAGRRTAGASTRRAGP